ncbi:glycosyltransferase [Vulcanisaeta distributa]|uniref:glycosyltransferase family 2 protein n=1 Tax=Vulcanisaeta distributa TaxID=164451 RepID=UPI0006D28CC7|nr:glycosyltransferase family 2 protein [Vulcanisaeta distributa]
MRVSVIVPTYKRAWSLPYLLNGLVNQSIKPHEVIIVLKPSGDGSEDVIRRYEDKLNIRVIIQERGYAIDAYDMGIKEADGDLLLFIDDDAVPHEDWVRRYIELFSKLTDAGAIGGLSYKAYVVNGEVKLTNELLFSNEITKDVFYRKPLKELHDYCRWLSVSGFPGSKPCIGPIVKSVLLIGMNMGFKSDILRELNLSKAYIGSRRGFHFESYVAYYVIKRGYSSYHVLDNKIAPIVWHIESHRESLTRKPGFWSEFWLHFDRSSMYFRLKRLGANVSLPAYLAANVSLMRRKPLPRLLATIYAILYNSLFL